MKSEKGFSIAEQLVVWALAALVALGGSIVTAHILRVSKQTREWGQVVNQTGTIGYWVGHDLPMADEISTDDPETSDTELLTLVWKDWETGVVYNVHYAILGAFDSLKQIERRFYAYRIIDGEEFVFEDKATIVAEDIYQAEITQNGNLWKLSIGSRSGSRFLLQEYDVYSRLNYYGL